MKSHNKTVFASALILLILTACSQESQPYVEENNSLPSAQEQGYIQTH